jgi:hypothetical protein
LRVIVRKVALHAFEVPRIRRLPAGLHQGEHGLAGVEFLPSIRQVVKVDLVRAGQPLLPEYAVGEEL